MSSKWEAVYPSRINWANGSGGKTPVDEGNLNKGDKALREIDDRVLKLGVINDYVLNATGWTNLADDLYYDWKYTISTDIYSDDSSPEAIVYTNGDNETEDAHNALSYIGKVWVDSTGVKIYATSKPNIDLNLRIRGI